MDNSKIVVKKIISLTLAFSFLVMSFTGLMLYIVPKGKIAYWANWKMLGLTKTQYADIHITTMILFLVVTIWHIYYNWKPLISYIKNSAKKITFFKKELLIALGLNVLFVAGTLSGIQPFQSVLDLNDNIKSYWEREYGSPPYGHAEESSLQSFSRRIGVDTQEAMELLKENNIKVESSKQKLLDISNQNNIAPKVIYDIIKQKRTSKNDVKVDFLGRKILD
ncbi:MAG: DUF4405 domain-containing protein [Sulfurimonas sp.]|jgi:hypothetical protein|nr:DUF4405 domain-containing protein [Sulfurimonas sp.]